MPAPIALQLYTVREALARDFEATVRAVAEIGYAGVETAGFAGTTPERAAALFGELGLSVCAVHAPLPLGGERDGVLATLRALGCTRLICSWQPPEQFKTREGIRRVCALLNEAVAVARDNGVSLGYHNHWWEFEPVEGRPAHAHLRGCLDEAVFFEPDAYWIRAAGGDPAAVLAELGARAPLVHLKDGPGVVGRPHVALGDGVVDVPGVVAAGAGNVEWWVVELDECATDMLDAVRRSYAYLTGKGLARGRA